MNNFKNLLIAVLTGLLALSLFTQPAQSASNTSAKASEYEHCLSGYQAGEAYTQNAINACKRFRP